MTFGDQEENHVRQEDVLNACYCVDEIRQNLCEFVISNSSICLKLSDK